MSSIFISDSFYLNAYMNIKAFTLEVTVRERINKY